MPLTFKWTVVFFVLMCCPFLSLGQEKDTKVDSTKMYSNIEKYSKKRKFTKFIHKLIFEPVAKEKIKKSSFQKSIKKNYQNYNGKIIRKIYISTLDPFGYSEVDTLKKPKLYRDRVGNSLHFKSREATIRNLLLIKKNTELDSLLVNESERLIRSQRFIRGVSSRVEPVSPNSDSVDVYIRVLDSWSLVPNFSTSTSNSTFSLSERNFMGVGHEVSGTYRESLTSKDNSYSTSYIIPNFLQTFIRTELNYRKEVDGSFGKVVSIERPFYSTFSHWAGGVYFDQQYRKLNSQNTDPNVALESFKYTTQDYWLGYAFQIFKGKSVEDRTTNFFVSGRHVQVTYDEQPSVTFDPLEVLSDDAMYLTSIGINSRKFTQDKYLFDFNVTEDIASGFIYSITAGTQHKNSRDRLYLGGRFAVGRYFPFGYLSTNLEYGTFFRSKITEQSALNINIVYFTNLIEVGKWKFRQFIKPQLVIGNNRIDSTFDRLTLSGEYGIQGFDSTIINGTKKAIINFQTQGYSPWQVWGFRLNPFLSYSMGILSNVNNTFRDSKIYSQIGAGVIVSNDFLVFNSFQFSFSYYPSLPNDDSSFKTNAIRTYDLRLPNFEVSKPGVVVYQ
jgi:hypothetical protein